MNNENTAILVVDDDHDIVNAISALLEREGYKIYKAYNGLEALDALMQYDVQLILIDVMMPKMDGLSAMMKIRTTKNIPVIVLSAKSEDSDKILGLSISLNHIIPSNSSQEFSLISAATLVLGLLTAQKKIMS